MTLGRSLSRALRGHHTDGDVRQVSTVAAIGLLYQVNVVFA